jgi:hypothetical protein
MGGQKPLAFCMKRVERGQGADKTKQPRELRPEQTSAPPGWARPRAPGPWPRVQPAPPDAAARLASPHQGCVGPLPTTDSRDQGQPATSRDPGPRWAPQGRCSPIVTDVAPLLTTDGLCYEWCGSIFLNCNCCQMDDYTSWKRTLHAEWGESV